MPLENYKKWIVIIIIAAAAGIVIAGLISAPSDRREKTARRSPGIMPPAPGPLIDQDLKRVIPVEELGVDMNNPQSLAALGDRYFESRKFHQAIEIYKKVLELNPKDVDTYNDLGLAYHYTNRSALAIETLKNGTGVMPQFQRIWLSLGYVLASTGQDEEAKPVLKKAVEMNPDTVVGQEAKRMLGLLKEGEK